METIRKYHPFEWTKVAKRGFRLLKQKITEKPILELANFQKLFEVKCDASGMAIGDILSQEERPISYFSDKLNDSKKKYSSYDKEFYVVIQALKKWRHNLMPKLFCCT